MDLISDNICFFLKPDANNEIGSSINLHNFLAKYCAKVLKSAES